jgi:hypothetical protein
LLRLPPKFHPGKGTDFNTHGSAADRDGDERAGQAPGASAIVYSFRRANKQRGGCSNQVRGCLDINKSVTASGDGQIRGNSRFTSFLCLKN